MSTAETESDSAVRAAVCDALLAADRLPIRPLIDIICQYAIQFRSVVSTIYVSGGDLATVGINAPYGVSAGWFGDDSSFVVSDVNSKLFVRLTLFGTGALSLVAGTPRQSGAASGPAFESTWKFPSAACVDPTNPNRWYLVDSHTVRSLDLSASTDSKTAAGQHAAGLVTLIAGASESAFKDGVGSEAHFKDVCDLVCTSDGTTLIVCDTKSNRLRSIDVKSRTVTTVLGTRGGRNGQNVSGPVGHGTINHPTALTFDRTCGVKPDSAVFVACGDAVVRFDRHAGFSRVFPLKELPPFEGKEFVLYGIASVPNGLVLVSCIRMHCLYSFDPTTERVELIAGGSAPASHRVLDGSALSEAGFMFPRGLCAVDAHHSLFIAESGSGRVRRMTLPPSWFTPSI